MYYDIRLFYHFFGLALRCFAGLWCINSVWGGVRVKPFPLEPKRLLQQSKRRPSLQNVFWSFAQGCRDVVMSKTPPKNVLHSRYSLDGSSAAELLWLLIVQCPKHPGNDEKCSSTLSLLWSSLIASDLVRNSRSLQIRHSCPTDSSSSRSLNSCHAQPLYGAVQLCKNTLLSLRDPPKKAHSPF